MTKVEILREIATAIWCGILGAFILLCLTGGI